MPLSKSMLSYPDVKDVLDRTIESPKGIKVQFKSMSQARMFAFRCNAFRGLDRRENAKIFPDTTAHLHNRSVYDVIRVSVKDDMSVHLTIQTLDGELEEL